MQAGVSGGHCALLLVRAGCSGRRRSPAVHRADVRLSRAPGQLCPQLVSTVTAAPLRGLLTRNRLPGDADVVWELSANLGGATTGSL